MNKDNFFQRILVLCTEQEVADNLDMLVKLDPWKYVYILDSLLLGIKLKDSFDILETIFQEGLEQPLKLSDYFYSRILNFTNQLKQPTK